MNAIYNNWRLSGWAYHDIFVIVAAVIFAILLCFLLYSLIKRRNTKRLVPYLIILLIYGVVVNFIGVVFFGMFRAVSIEGNSQLFYSESTHSLTSIERMVIPNGHANGISTSTSMFALISVDSRSGERLWSKRMGWRNYLIGQTKRYLIVNDANNEALFLLDARTGEKRFSEAELLEKIPELSGIISPDFPDYRFVERRLYLHGLNNRYYQLDLENWTLTEDPTIKTVFQDSPAPEWIISSSHRRAGQPVTDDEISEVLNLLSGSLINPVLLGKKQAHQYYVLAYKKRHSRRVSIGLYDTDKERYLWQTPAILSKEGDPVNAYQVGDSLYIRIPRYLLKLDINTGTPIYRFDYRWNRVTEAP